MQIQHEPGYRSYFHRDCEQNKWRSGVMRPLQVRKKLADGSRLIALECLCCGDVAWFGVDKNGTEYAEKIQ